MISGLFWMLEEDHRRRREAERLRSARKRAQEEYQRQTAGNGLSVIEGECERVADPLELPAPEGES